MVNMLRIILIWIGLLSATICYSAVYMHKDSNGNIIYSDTPLDNAAKINVPTVLNYVPSTQSSAVTKDNAKSLIALTEKKYTDFEIISPKDQDTIQNQPIFPVILNIKPELQKGDKVQLILDNQIYGIAQESTQIQLDQVERGTHQLYAVLLDKEQRVIQQSNVITIYVHRASAKFKTSKKLPVMVNVLPA